MMRFVVIFFLIQGGFISAQQREFSRIDEDVDFRTDMIQKNVRLAEWHKPAFWPLYENYRSDMRGKLVTSGMSDGTGGDDGLFDHFRHLLSERNHLLTLRKKYYRDIGAVLNGVVALQFLQTEILADLKDEITRFPSAGIGPSETGIRTRDAWSEEMRDELVLSDSMWQIFTYRYAQFSEERNALLGDQYNLYEFFAGDPSDFHPALAKRLGYELLQVIEREQRLKERHFAEMAQLFGRSVATRFLVREDSLSRAARELAWADSPLWIGP